MIFAYTTLTVTIYFQDHNDTKKDTFQYTNNGWFDQTLLWVLALFGCLAIAPKKFETLIYQASTIDQSHTTPKKNPKVSFAQKSSLFMPRPHFNEFVFNKQKQF